MPNWSLEEQAADSTIKEGDLGREGSFSIRVCLLPLANLTAGASFTEEVSVTAGLLVHISDPERVERWEDVRDL